MEWLPSHRENDKPRPAAVDAQVLAVQTAVRAALDELRQASSDRFANEELLAKAGMLFAMLFQEELRHANQLLQEATSSANEVSQKDLSAANPARAGE